ncbi:ribosomal RNA small subunit methyltransferase G [Variibacter gotjawalensis]|uniref:Ribosomal RNA small subunit methyltransferase G n=2 Tax=Variibacter gotjawalensis TaxID=1333996 RepID=A0A0S3PR11_9BRAD|nr:16S rRNA (guanine(527)-N(7))-methyltransferase RsmG [Variibacter gotjawalensis]RZS50387.1 16S rRNA (guanine527-N7)-methyltransferase [Variibacter gotjawalensis]BAT58222.1 ribosomal RNA small subunit methyltransferase G [Variibacter gotjawalensis]
MERLDAIVEQLRIWQQRINLVAPSTVSEVWTRHVGDSWQLLALAPDARLWVDLGSGGGFPGLVVAAALVDRGGSIHLVESNNKKAAFLRECARIAGLPVKVHAKRIEEFAASFAEAPDIVSARALAPMDKLLDYVEPFLKKGAQALLPKGQDVEQELTQAAISWHIDAELVPSVIEPHAKIVRVLNARRR